ncbi:MAG: outer membrane beta-barrel protein [Planctomycetota bacterium]
MASSVLRPASPASIAATLLAAPFIALSAAGQDRGTVDPVEPDLSWETDGRTQVDTGYRPSRGLLAGAFRNTRPSVYAKGGGMIVFPFATDAESDTLGVGTTDLEFRSEIGGGYYAALGLRLGPGPKLGTPGVGVRIEAEFADRSYEPDGLFEEDDDFFDEDSIFVLDVDGDVDVQTYMGNILIDIAAGEFRGYFGVGFGAADVDIEFNGVSESTTEFAVQFPLGVEVQLIDHLWLDFGCRWLFIPDIDTDTDVSEFSIFTAEIYAGLMVEF